MIIVINLASTSVDFSLIIFDKNLLRLNDNYN